MPAKICQHPNNTDNFGIYRVVIELSDDGKPLCAAIQRWIEPIAGRVTTRRLLFIHGMEYHNAKEVTRDFVEPFLQNSGLNRFDDLRSTEILFAYWPSCIAPCAEKSFDPNDVRLSLARKLLRTTVTGWKHGLETRLHNAASDLYKGLSDYGLLVELPNTTVVSHSLGATVWALAAKRIIENTTSHAPDLGNWINLQPALNADAFSSNEIFSSVAECYLKNQRQLSVLYSRFDLILRSMYWLTTGKAAMGQIGSNVRAVRSFDVSRLVGEAHGTFRFNPRSGCFFRRASGVIRHLMRQVHSATVDQPSLVPSSSLAQ